MTDITADKLVRAHLKLRDAIEKLAAEYKVARAELEAKKDAVDVALRDICKDLGAESIKTEYGTAWLSVKPQYNTLDWDAFLTFMVENDCLHLVQQRVAQKNMQDFLDTHPDQVPPGLTSNNKLTVTVRRTTSKS